MIPFSHFDPWSSRTCAVILLPLHDHMHTHEMSLCVRARSCEPATVRERESYDAKRNIQASEKFWVEICEIEAERSVRSPSSHDMQMRESMKQGNRQVSHWLLFVWSLLRVSCGWQRISTRANRISMFGTSKIETMKNKCLHTLQAHACTHIFILHAQIYS